MTTQLAMAPLAFDTITGTATVVLVDDDIVSLSLLEIVLAELPGCRTVAFSNPAEARDWCARGEPDLVITDFHMPGTTGLDLLVALRENVHTREVPLIMVTSEDDQESRNRALAAGANDYLIKPIDRVEVRVRAGNLLALRKAWRSLADRAGWLAREVAAATERIAGREREIVQRLSRAAEHRDWETGAHILRIGMYSRIMADQLGLPSDEVDAISWAAPMHDVGKIGIPDYVLLKPGRLDDAEFAIMKKHTTYGWQILGGSDVPLLQLAAEVALSHHERFDGAGYPNGSTGEKIPYAGRIVAVADVFDALTSARPYKRPWDADAAFAHLVEGAGTHFDPACVAACVRRRDDILAAQQQYRDEFPDGTEFKIA